MTDLLGKFKPNLSQPMRQTKKYSLACEVLTVPHDTQDHLYSELNRLGWFWDAKLQQWIRDDRLADPPTDLIRIRVWSDKETVGDMADRVAQALRDYGFTLQERSESYLCRPPKQAEARIYLTFLNSSKEGK